MIRVRLVKAKLRPSGVSIRLVEGEKKKQKNMMIQICKGLRWKKVSYRNKKPYKKILSTKNIYIETFLGAVTRRRRKDTSNDDKRALNHFVAETIENINNSRFQPEKFTDPRVPIYSFQMKFIQFDKQSLLKLVNGSLNVKLQAQDNRGLVGICHGLFNMRNIGFNSFESLVTGNKRFDNLIHTDSYEVEFIYRRMKVTKSRIVTPEDIDSEVDIIGVDPGMRDVYVASDGTSSDRHRVHRTNQAECYDICGYNSATKRRKKQKGVQGTGRRLLKGSKKYRNHHEISADIKKWKPLTPCGMADEQEKTIVIAFGAAAISTLMVACPLCQTKSLYHVHSVLRCKNCAAWWNRDHMASMNIRSIFIHMVPNGNKRPSIFSRST
ncbi:MAG: hypothetical protein EXX96DRAFT_605804, partial [Benjaminiella poitrasii]